MTNLKANKFANAINSNVEAVKDRNKTKVAKLAMLVRDDAVNEMLNKSNIDAKRFADRALYATEKCVKIVYAVTRETVNVADLNANAFATIKTALLAMKAETTFSKLDVEASLSKDVKRAKDAKNAIYTRDAILSDATLAAQSQQCVDMLKTLQLVEETTKNVFAVKADSALMKEFSKKFADITM